jgi:hypothetical protein
MYHYLTSVQKGDAVRLQQYIDNSEGRLRVGLRAITYTVGWHNVKTIGTAAWATNNTGGAGGPNDKAIHVWPGLYSFKQVRELVTGEGGPVVFSLDKTDGVIKLVVDPGRSIQLPDELMSLLGLDDGLGGRWLHGPDAYKGDRPVNFTPLKGLYIHLEQINTTGNIVDGAPSTLLAVVDLREHEFGDIRTLRISRPEFKRLRSGAVNEWNLTIRDEAGNTVDNHNMPINLTLEITSS